MNYNIVSRKLTEIIHIKFTLIMRQILFKQRHYMLT